MKLIYSPQARVDLREIKAYIRDNLQNPTAAENVTQKILKSCLLLKENPLLGAELSGKVDRETDLRYLYSRTHLSRKSEEDAGRNLTVSMTALPHLLNAVTPFNSIRRLL